MLISRFDLRSRDLKVKKTRWISVVASWRTDRDKTMRNCAHLYPFYSENLHARKQQRELICDLSWQWFRSWCKIASKSSWAAQLVYEYLDMTGIMNDENVAVFLCHSVICSSQWQPEHFCVIQQYVSINQWQLEPLSGPIATHFRFATMQSVPW